MLLSEHETQSMFEMVAEPAVSGQTQASNPADSPQDRRTGEGHQGRPTAGNHGRQLSSSHSDAEGRRLQQSGSSEPPHQGSYLAVLPAGQQGTHGSGGSTTNVSVGEGEGDADVPDKAHVQAPARSGIMPLKYVAAHLRDAPSWLPQFISLAVAMLPSLPTQSLVVTCHGLCQLRPMLDRGQVSAILSALQQRSSQMKAQDLAGTLASVAKLQVQPPEAWMQASMSQVGGWHSLRLTQGRDDACEASTAMQVSRQPHKKHAYVLDTRTGAAPAAELQGRGTVNGAVCMRTHEVPAQ
jgi:hypothetical protein